MQVSKNRVNKNLQNQVDRMWFQMVADIKSPKEAEVVFKEILSDMELAVMTKRVAVGYWLNKNRSYENIRDNLKVSSATIATIHQRLKTPGWKMALEKVLAEEWATKWEIKINNLFKIRK